MLCVLLCWALFSELPVFQFRAAENYRTFLGERDFIRNTKPNSCDWRVFTKSSNGYQKEGLLRPSGILHLRKHFFPISRAAATSPLAAFQSSEQHNSLSKWEGINLVSELWQNWAIQCLECSSWAASCKDPSACCSGKGAGGEGIPYAFTSLILLLVWKLIVDFCMVWFGFVVLCLHVNSRHLDSVLTTEWPRWREPSRSALWAPRIQCPLHQLVAPGTPQLFKGE